MLSSQTLSENKNLKRTLLNSLCEVIITLTKILPAYFRKTEKTWHFDLQKSSQKCSTKHYQMKSINTERIIPLFGERIEEYSNFVRPYLATGASVVHTSLKVSQPDCLNCSPKQHASEAGPKPFQLIALTNWLHIQGSPKHSLLDI